MFQPGKLYRHISTLDIDLFISGILPTGSVIVRYWNRHYKMFQGNQEVVVIKESDYSKWSEV